MSRLIVCVCAFPRRLLVCLPLVCVFFFIRLLLFVSAIINDYKQSHLVFVCKRVFKSLGAIIIDTFILQCLFIDQSLHLPTASITWMRSYFPPSICFLLVQIHLLLPFFFLLISVWCFTLCFLQSVCVRLKQCINWFNFFLFWKKRDGRTICKFELQNSLQEVQLKESVSECFAQGEKQELMKNTVWNKNFPFALINDQNKRFKLLTTEIRMFAFFYVQLQSLKWTHGKKEKQKTKMKISLLFLNSWKIVEWKIFSL